VTPALFGRFLDEEIHKMLVDVGEARFVAGRYREARDLFQALSTKRIFDEFLTLPAYDLLLALTGSLK
jgi:malate synthase